MASKSKPKKSSSSSSIFKSITPRSIIIFILLIAVIVGLGFLLSPRPSNGGSFASFTGNYNNSRNLVNSTINSTNLAKLTQNWFINTNYSVTSTPLVNDGIVYFSDWGGNVYAANVTTGDVLWKVNLNHYVSQMPRNITPISSTQAISGGILYVADGVGSDAQHKNNLFTLNLTNGNVIWQDNNSAFNSSMNSVWSSPTVYDGMVYIGVSGTTWPPVPGDPFKRGAIYAFNATTGAKIWNVTMAVGDTEGAGIWSTVVVNPVLNSIYIGTGNAGAYTGTNDTYAYAIVSMNASTGAKNWVYQAYNSTATGGDFDFGATPNLFTIRIDNVVYKAVGDGNKDGNYYIVDMTNGTLLKTYKIGLGGSGIIGNAGFTYLNSTNPKLFIPSYYKVNTTVQGAVTAMLPSSGAVLWRFYTPAYVVGSVTIVPGAVLFGDDAGNFYAVNSISGKTIYEQRFPGTQINAGTTAAEGHVFVPTSFGAANQMGLYAFSTT